MRFCSPVFYDWWTFVGIGVFGTALTIAVALAVFVMLYRISRQFWTAWALSLLSFGGFLFNIAPRPVFFSVIFFTIVLTLILEAQRSGRVQLLYWLPLIFIIWANTHIQFIYGIALVGLLAGINLLQRIAISLGLYPESLTNPTLPVTALFAIFGSAWWPAVSARIRTTSINRCFYIRNRRSCTK